MFNSLPNDKNLDCPEVKTCADNKINVNEKLKFWFEKGRKQCGKRRKLCWLPVFLIFPQCFLKPSISGLLKVGTVW